VQLVANLYIYVLQPDENGSALMILVVISLNDLCLCIQDALSVAHLNKFQCNPNMFVALLAEQ